MTAIKSVMFLFVLAFCTSSFALANPAATNCTDKGFKYMLVQNIGICVFPDSSYCEEWSYFKGQCKQGQNVPVTGNNNLPNQTQQLNKQSQ